MRRVIAKVHSAQNGPALAIALLVGCTVSAAGPPQSLAQVQPALISDVNGGCCVVAHVDVDGTARVGFSRNAFPNHRVGRIFAAIASPGGELTRAQTLRTVGPDHLSFGAPAFAWTSRGRAVAAWRAAAGEGGRRARGIRIFASVQRSDRSWSAPQSLSRAGGGARLPRIALDAAGNAIVAWQALGRGGWRVDVARRAAGASRFGRSRAISRPIRCCPWPAVTVAGKHAIIAWANQNEIRAVRTTGARTQSPIRLGRGRVGRDDIDVAIDQTGNAVVTWREWVRGNRAWRMHVAELPVSARPVVRQLGTEIPATDDDGSVRDDVGPRVAVDSGESVVVAPRIAGGVLGAFVLARGATAWTGPLPIGSSAGADVDLSSAEGRGVIAAWSEQPDRIALSIRAPGLEFGLPIVIAGSPGARRPAVAAGAGRVVAGWLTDDGITGAVAPLR